MANDSKSTEKSTAGEMPFFDFTKLMSQSRQTRLATPREPVNVKCRNYCNRSKFEYFSQMRNEKVIFL